MNEENLTRREKNIERVTAFALKSFIENGIDNSTVSEIANKAGLTERSAFRYFETKADLVLSAAKLFYKNISLNVIKECKRYLDSEMDGINKVKRVIKEYSKLYFTSKNELIFIEEAEAYLRRYNKQDLIKTTNSIDFKSSNEPLSLAIKDGIKDGTVRNDDILEGLYYNTYDSLLGLLEKMALNKDSMSDDEANFRLTIYVDTLINMYKSDK